MFSLNVLIQGLAHKMGYELRRVRSSPVVSAAAVTPVAPEELCQDINLVGRIHKNDLMFEGDANHYVNVGLSALKNIEDSLLLVGKTFSDINYCLDLPCGYGRVLRFLRLKIPPQRITACEIDKEAVDFCEKEFGAEPLLSQENLRAVTFTKKYNLIWVGSLVTHIQETSFRDLLQTLYETLEDGGVLVFTTHGEHSIEKMNGYGVHAAPQDELKQIFNEYGYYFTPYYHSKNYGISLCSRDYVESVVAKLFKGKLKLIRYQYRGWDNHQDVYSFQKTKPN